MNETTYDHIRKALSSKVNLISFKILLQRKFHKIRTGIQTEITMKQRKSTLYFKVPLHDMEVNVWCAQSV
jgi:hypothetical protein